LDRNYSIVRFSANNSAGADVFMKGYADLNGDCSPWVNRRLLTSVCHSIFAMEILEARYSSVEAQPSF